MTANGCENELSPSRCDGPACLCRAVLYISVAYAIVRCLSVRLSHLCILSKRINIGLSSKFFHYWVYSHNSSFSIPNAMTIFRRGRPNCGKNRDFRPISGFGIDHYCTVECRQHCDGGVCYSTLVAAFARGRWTTQRHASVNLVYDRKTRRYAEDNRTEFNCRHW